MTDLVAREAHAKVNLFLRVLAREDDGYHGIETLLCRLALADRVTVRRADHGVTLETEATDLGPAEENLAVRAARAALDATRSRFGVHITLEKRIPVAAGLGGGSADAAAVLSAVNELAENRLSRAELLHLAARIGADVPFCLSGESLALAWGHGERMLALPALPPAPVLLLCPSAAIRTAEAYRWVDAVRPAGTRRGALLLDPGALAGWSDVARMAGNEFESVVFGRIQGLREAFEALAGTHPLLCRMSGSGSALCAVYRSPRDRDDARSGLGRRHGVTISTDTV